MISLDDQIRHRFAVLTWAVGITAALVIAMMSVVINMSYQLGQIAGELSILVNHVQMK